MKKWIALMLLVMLMLPAAAMAENVQPDITFTYNGQTYDCRFFIYEKCCGEVDTSYDLRFEPAGCDRVDSATLTLPTTIETGTQYVLHAGDGMQWLAFYTTGKDGIRNFVSEPGTLFGSGMIAPEDYLEVIVHSAVYERGVLTLNASLKGVFLSGAERFEIDFEVSFGA